ncbi:hypothetical protein J132_08518 [Termitomyces sp. J132]|nr:hypothetical protein H2248_006281 [Termitomyces sp. 'cryptogamus']KNZ79860.1 hypothetical protein J132_08518 [Termitomyces sp. J132]
MTTYYPTQGPMNAGQPVVYAAANGYNAGYAPTAGAYLGQPEALGVPYQGSHHTHRSRHSHRSHHHSHGQPVIAPVAAPVVLQPGHAGYGVYAPDYYRLSFVERLRRFFGLAPRGPFKYRNNKGTWGFMGYSRRQRYSDARTGAEVDRKGRPIYRV